MEPAVLRKCKETQPQKDKHHISPHTQMQASEIHILESIYKSVWSKWTLSG